MYVQEKGWLQHEWSEDLLTYVHVRVAVYAVSLRTAQQKEKVRVWF